MDKELPGGSSLLGSSVWSMHPTATPTEIQANAAKTHHHHHHHNVQGPGQTSVLQKLSGPKVSSSQQQLNNLSRAKANSSQKPVCFTF
jgi:hypothetical protein